MPSKTTLTKKTPKKTPTEKLKDEIKSLKVELTQQDDKHIRLKAEFDNYRRRKSQEIIDLLKYDGENVVKDFLSILDDLDRLKEAFSDIESSDVSKISEGINLIINRINKQFEELGVVQFTEVGDVVDPELHDALMMRNEIQRGRRSLCCTLK